MRTVHTFKPGWFFFALVATVLVVEALAMFVRQFVSIPISPIGLGALAVSGVALATSLLCDEK